ncbi:MAG: ABC transporter ATP-binding protein [Actinomycetota bacterium]
MSEHELIVDARGVSRTYRSPAGPVSAVQDVDLEVAPGELVAICGPSGCGKTTMLNLLGALDRPDEGEITVAGTRIDRLGSRAAAEWRAASIGLVFQTPGLVEALTAEENVEMAMRITGAPRRHRRVRPAEVLAALGLSEHLRHRPRQLSGGQRQRVALARALVTQPSLVLADEPTAALDSERSGQVMGLLRELVADRGVTIIVTTHDELVASQADRRVQIESGRIV